ncbi:MATE family efflux transporter [Tepidibacter formicigenes]|jgi:putative MATE family efflux protein|uniref:Multidrug export protein MepA n=1 Tax=Tepidibacter formicigenes DSM 15518 TaxID=1123349 RepID=A0A1M6JED8_9FIRM|nr:MATE family efflux transporter [Tepidibacter formicigenes]SHJ45048.1 putative efflux protein, MATE family [Tepidibacter formicigenes DSM 15518]
MEKQKRLGTEDVGKLLIQFSFPAIIGMLINVLYNIVDRIFIGKGVGAIAISGVGLTLPFMTIIMAFGMLAGIGGAALISIRLGEGKHSEAEKILGNTFVLLSLISISVTIVGLTFLDPLLKAFGASDITYTYAKEYITIILAGAILNALGFGLNNAIRSDGSPKTAMITNLIGAITNIILDYVFIMRLNMGIKGAALATVIGQSFNTIWVLRYFILSKKSSLKLRINNLKLDFNIVKSIFAIGMSPFAIQLASSVVNVLANNTLKANGGDYAIGAMSILISIAMIFLMPVFGITQGAQPIIGYNYGALKIDRVKKSLILAISAASTLCILGFISIEFFPKFMVSIFSKDENILKIGSHGLKIFLCMVPIIGFQIVTSNFFQAIGKAKISMLLSLSRQVLILIPLLLILPKFFGLNGVWIAYPISDGLSSLLTLIFLIKEWKIMSKQKVDSEEIDNINVDELAKV